MFKTNAVSHGSQNQADRLYDVTDGMVFWVWKSSYEMALDMKS